MTRKYYPHLSLWIACILPLIVAAARAEIPFTLEFEFTIADSVYPSTAGNLVQFTDVDFDGVDDLVFRGSSIISAYSVANQELIYYFRLKEGGYPRKYVEGFFDSDNQVDLLELVIVPQPSGQALKAVIYASSEGFTGGDSTLLLSITNSEPHLIDALFLRDMNGDNYDEVYGQIHWVEEHWWSMTEVEYIYHYTEFRTVPEGWTTEIIDALPTDTVSAVGSGELYADGRKVYWSTYTLSTSGSAHGQGSWSSRSVGLSIFGLDSVISNFIFSSIYDCGFLYEDRSQSASLYSLWIGDVMTTSPRYEMLLHVGYGAHGAGPWGYCDLYSRHLFCYDLSTPGSRPKLWSLDEPEFSSTAYLFSDAQFPNQFFVHHADRFYLYDATTAMALDSSIRIDNNGIMISYRTIDSGAQEYAILRHNRTFSFCTLEEAGATGVDLADRALPESLVLHQPYPNPFNAQITIPVTMQRAGQLKVEVFNLLGRKVATVSNGHFSMGNHELHWGAEGSASGVYLFRAAAGAETATIKATLIK